VKYISKYQSKIGEITIISEDNYLINLFFSHSISINFKENEIVYEDNEIIKNTKKWLDLYFNKCVPNIDIPIKLHVSKFVKEVLDIVYSIPYGEVRTYKNIGDLIMNSKNINKMSYGAIGQAIAKNPICLIISCHRVIAKKGIGGYSQGIDRKKYLLKPEGYKEK